MTSPDLIGAFEERTFPYLRSPTLDTLAWGRKRHHIPILLEVDVTIARNAIRDHKARTGEGVSFTGWIVKCVAQAISEHKHVHAIRHGRRRLVIFDDVDVTIAIERAVRQEDVSETLPMPYVVRKASEKSVADIHAEIRAAQTSPVASGEVQVDSSRPAWLTKLGTMLPTLVRDVLIWRPLFRNPFLIKRTMGTVSVTAVGMFGQGRISWGIPIGIHPLIIAVGGITQRPTLVHEQVVMHEYMGLTVMFDHDVTDGAPAARFIARLVELMESGYGLLD